jgi:hypothetical protein
MSRAVTGHTVFRALYDSAARLGKRKRQFEEHWRSNFDKAKAQPQQTNSAASSNKSNRGEMEVRAGTRMVSKSKRGKQHKRLTCAEVDALEHAAVAVHFVPAMQQQRRAGEPKQYEVRTCRHAF